MGTPSGYPQRLPPPPYPGIPQQGLSPQTVVLHQSSSVESGIPDSVFGPIGVVPGSNENGGNEVNLQFLRKLFIRKVCAVLWSHMMVISGIVAVCTYCVPVKMWIYDGIICVSISFICRLVGSVAAVITLVLVLVVAEDFRRRGPQNFIFFYLFTLLMGVALGALAATLDTEIVLMTVGIAGGLYFALMLFTFITKLNFTTCKGSFYCLILCSILIGICFGVLPQAKALLVLYSSLVGFFVFIIYPLYDMYLMTAQKHMCSVSSPEEFFFAATTIYLDYGFVLMQILALFAINVVSRFCCLRLFIPIKCFNTKPKGEAPAEQEN